MLDSKNWARADTVDGDTNSRASKKKSFSVTKTTLVPSINSLTCSFAIFRESSKCTPTISISSIGPNSPYLTKSSLLISQTRLIPVMHPTSACLILTNIDFCTLLISVPPHLSLFRPPSPSPPLHSVRPPSLSSPVPSLFRRNCSLVSPWFRHAAVLPCAIFSDCRSGTV